MTAHTNGNPGFSLFVLAFGLVLPAYVFGHGVEVYDLSAEDRPVRTVYFKYSTDEPVSFARIKLYPPSTREGNVESLVSITDRNGLFCFIPDEEGEWRVDMEDGMGHKGSISVNSVFSGEAPDAESGGGPGNAARPPLAFNIALGISLLLNIFGLWHILAARRRTAGGGGEQCT
jgi:nickel transport protein